MLVLAGFTPTAVRAAAPGPIGNDPGCFSSPPYDPVYVVWEVPEDEIDGVKIYRHIEGSSNSTV